MSINLFFKLLQEIEWKIISSNSFFNNILKTFLILVLYSVSSQAQNFFPLSTLNKYQIFEERMFTDFQYVMWTNTWENYGVLGDSLIGGNQFFNFSELFVGPFQEEQYYFYNQQEQIVYTKLPSDDTVRIAVDFNSPAGTGFTSYIRGNPIPFVSQGISGYPIFDDTVQAFKMVYYTPDLKFEYIFADEIGICYFYKLYETENYRVTHTQRLKSAIIGNSTFNPIYLTIIDLYPLENRPVSAFPFNLFGVYSTNINLVDSFYVNVKHVRGQDTIANLKYNMPDNYTNINLNPLAGDKLLLQAWVTDNSIFMNRDQYPDSGYAEILVLENPTDADEYNNLISFSLEQNYPNPFNPTTIIKYSIASASFVTLTVYDVMGNEIAILINEEKQPGVYKTEFNGSDLASGIYFYRLSTRDKNLIKRMMILK